MLEISSCCQESVSVRLHDARDECLVFELKLLELLICLDLTDGLSLPLCDSLSECILVHIAFVNGRCSVDHISDIWKRLDVV